MTDTLSLILGSAAVGALVSSAINSVVNYLNKRAESERQDMEIALKMAELKHQQMVTVNEWNLRHGVSQAVEFWDPLMSVIEYRRAMAEYRKTRRWEKGESAHPIRSA